MSYQPKVYRKQGGNELVVASGGKITVLAGGSIESVASVRVQNEDTYAITAGMSGLLYIGTKSSTTQVISLPAANTVPGMTLTFLCGDAGGEINVDPGAATFKITGKGITVAATKDLKNTAGSNAVGDSVTIVSDGVDTWWITAIQGTWATT